MERFGADVCAQVPGLVRREEDGRAWWSVGGSPGLLIPVRNLDGRIVALKLRRDEPGDGPRYLYMSSARAGGPGPGAPVHVPLFDGATDCVRLSEGELKSDIATTLDGMLTISAPGVTAWRAALPVLRRLGAREVRVAFDADAREKLPVARALQAVVEALEVEGFQPKLEVW